MSRNSMIVFRAAGATMLACVLVCVVAAGSAFAAPKLVLRTITPDTVQAGQEMALRYWVQNVGDTATQGPITVVDTFGSPVTSVKLQPEAVGLAVGETSSMTPIGVECEGGTTSISCEITGTLAPGVQVGLQAVPTVPGEATGSISDRIVVSGGGTTGTEEEHSIEIGSPGAFGFDYGAVEFLNADGSPDVLAGSVPADFTTKLDWKSFFTFTNSAAPSINSNEFFKDVVAHLPPGVIGNPSASALCTTDELGTTEDPNQVEVQELPGCPQDSQIGIARVGIAGRYYTTGLFNVVPRTAPQLCSASTFSVLWSCSTPTCVRAITGSTS